jgi:hypothetical protein
VAAPNALDHVDAVTAAHAAASLTVFLGGSPPSTAPPYCVLYPEPGMPVRASLADDRVDYMTTVQITSVGETAEQALNYADRSAAAMSPALQVAGRTAWRPEHLDGQPVQRDDDVTPPVFYAVARYRLRSTPS